MKTSPTRAEGKRVISDPGAWEKLQAAFEGALQVDSADEREAFLLGTLSGSPELLPEAREMLRAHESAGPLAIEKRLLNEETGSESGRSIGAYRLERLLGRGGMGEVYLAERREPQFRQQVALKLLRTGWHSPEALARFRLERQILARLNHPLIAPLLDGGVTDDGQPYLVLQYVDGQPITDYCTRHQVPIERRLTLFCEVARAVEYAHRNLVVHRDLKPSNILVTSEGQIRLLDFGIAKLLDPSPEEIDVPATQVDARIMTPEYAAPEQVRGEPITTATDVYALGILLYELVAGRRPVPAGEEAPAPSRAVDSRLAKRLRGDLDLIVLKALAQEPEHRYPSAEEMARDIERHLAGRAIHIRAPSFRYRFEKLVRRNKVASALAAASLLLLAGLIVTATYQSRRILRERDLARSEQRKTENVVALLVELFTASNPMNTPRGSELTVGEFLQRTEGAIVNNRSLEGGVQARLKQLLGQVYLVRDQFSQARALLEDAVRQTRALYGDDSPATAAVLHDLAKLSATTEPPEKAVPLLRESLARHRRLYGDRHEKVAACLEDLGDALPLSEEKQRVLEQSLALRRSLSPNPSVELASTLTALGESHQAAGNVEPAERQYLEAARVLGQLFPQGHPASLRPTNNLATLYMHQGRFEEAVKLHHTLVELHSRLIGPETVGVAISLGNLGTNVAQQGDHRKAEEYFRRSLDLYVKRFGPEHAHVANAMRNIGRMRELQGDYAEAAKLLGRAVEIQRRTGKEEADLWGMESQLGLVLFRKGERAEGLRKLKAAQEKLAVLRPNHSYLADCQVRLGSALLESGAARQAESLFRDALTFRRASLPSHHPKIAEAECGLGGALALLGQPRQAETMLAKCLPVFRSWGLADPVTVGVLERQLRALR
jgi:serine/threonine-protein kinase